MARRLALLGGNLAWLVVLAWLASAAWFLCDDAFISFRYARNLVEGQGLVFNPGERVEGYTNFLWVLELAVLWKAFGLRPESVAPWLSVACTIGTLGAVVWWAAVLPGLRRRGLLIWMALGLLCTSATFAVWTSGGGLETRQFTFFVVLAVVCLSVHADSRRGLLAASLSLAAAAYTRPEGLLIAACCFGWFVAQRIVAARRLRVDVRELVWLAAPFVALVAAQFLFRYGYYGEWLPNTYYAKHVRPWYESGFNYLWAAAVETGLYLLMPLAVLAVRRAWRERGDLRLVLPLACIVPHMAYVFRIGGDYFEYRPLDFYWPLLAVPAAAGIVHLGSAASALLRRSQSARSALSAPGPWACAVVLFVPTLFYSGALQGHLLFQGVAAGSYLERFHPEVDQENGGWLLAAPGMRALASISNDLRWRMARQLVGLRFAEHREAAKLKLGDWADYERMGRGLFPEDALTATGALGIQSYYLPDLRVVDGHGLVDAVVARNPVVRSNRERLMAHDRRPPPGYVLEERGVNIMVLPSASSEEEALSRGAYAFRAAPDLWMSFDAADHEWVLSRFDRTMLRMQDERESRWELQAAAIMGYESGPATVLCEPGPTALCLQDGRYRVTLDWSGPAGSGDAARVADARTSEAGLFFFFAPENLEVLVKVLDGCEVNGHYWVSAASATDMGLDLVVRDVRSGAERRYTKTAGEPAAFRDTSAFRGACGARAL
ncbi:MAG: hypothetical protein F4210_11855 [Holophagales bacterium]|nr:hypothetical protein [Holophagales bacterium]MYF96178.1 hypothetical protein [Holophagales bacterium]